jgi:hypothetical protein
MPELQNGLIISILKYPQITTIFNPVISSKKLHKKVIQPKKKDYIPTVNFLLDFSTEDTYASVQSWSLFWWFFSIHKRIQQICRVCNSLTIQRLILVIIVSRLVSCVVINDVTISNLPDESSYLQCVRKMKDKHKVRLTFDIILSLTFRNIFLHRSSFELQDFTIRSKVFEKFLNFGCRKDCDSKT